MQRDKKKPETKGLFPVRKNMYRTGLNLAGAAIAFQAVVIAVGLVGQSLSSQGLPDLKVAVLGNAQPLTIPLSAQPSPHPDDFVLIEPASAALDLSLSTVAATLDATDPNVPPVASRHPSKSAGLAERNAKSALTFHLAKLKLKRALLAAQQASTQTKPVEISPEPNAVIAQANVIPTEDTSTSVAAAPATTVASVQTEAAPAQREQAPLRARSLAQESVAPVPAQRPRPLVRSNPGTRSKPGAITKPVRASSGSTVLAYATPGDPTLEKSGPFSGLGKVFSGSKGKLPGRGSGIAVYDISTATVHMPDGTKLEAHSGIGHRKDKPKYAYVKNLGPTPPNVYKLRMRERRFHGVEAIRMLPLDRAAMKGRDGMLAHTPLLRRTNGSHGCVAFKHYNKFLKAFKAGKVKTMIVVPTMKKLPTYMAKLNRSSGV